MLFSTFNEIFFWIFLSMNVLVVGGIILGLYRRFKALERTKSILLKGISAFSIWLVLTAVITIAAAAFFYGDTVGESERIIKLESATLYFLAFWGGWLLAGVVIIYLINRLIGKKLD